MRSRTGAEAILYTVHGSTDLPLRGVMFATEGVDEFMASVMNVDNQDLISKIKGFAVQGIKGSLCLISLCLFLIVNRFRKKLSKVLF
jgi:hypothetical protein